MVVGLSRSLRSLYRVRYFATFSSEEEYLNSLKPHSHLPKGFKVGTSTFDFVPQEVPSKKAKMTVTLIALDEPTDIFGAMFTSNAFPGAPIIVGRNRINKEKLSAIVINNKISNVCAPGGVEDAEAVCNRVAELLNVSPANSILPSSTGIIGWKLPVKSMIESLPAILPTLQSESILPAAKGICTTDLYPKVRSAKVPGTNGRIVGIAKGAGMVEPNLATMLVYILTDLSIPRDVLRQMLPKSVGGSFNALSIDSDQSTSDTVVLVSSDREPISPSQYPSFQESLTLVCNQLAEDIVRNGEGVQHVIKVRVRHANTEALAKAVGKAIVNSPLFKCAVAGNDPNVGRLVAAIGSCVGRHPDGGASTDLSSVSIKMGGLEIYGNGEFKLNSEVEESLIRHMKKAQLWESRPSISKDKVLERATNMKKSTELNLNDSNDLRLMNEDDRKFYFSGEHVSYAAPITFPPHEESVEIEVDLGLGNCDFSVIGNDLTHEYVAENADYRS